MTGRVSRDTSFEAQRLPHDKPVPIADAWAQDPRNPHNWSSARKWTVVWIASYVTLVVSLNSTAITTATESIATHFNVSNGTFEYVYLTVTAWNTAAALVPLVTYPLMEAYGMRWGYLTCYILFTVFVIPQALAPNFATLIVTRVIAGSFGGTCQNAIDGFIANLFRTAKERLLPMTVYIFALLAGVTLGPVFGGIATTGLDWPWIFWIQLIIYGASLPAVYFLIPETRGEVILAQIHAKEPQDSGTLPAPSTLNDTLREIREVSKIAVYMLFTSPVLASFTFLSALAFTLVFAAAESIALVYTTAYAFTTTQTAVVQISLLIGEALGLLLCIWQNDYYIKSAEHNPESSVDGSTTESPPVPEAILPATILSIPLLLAGGLFVYGFTALPSVPWIAPTIGLAMQGCAIQVIITAVAVYITDFYPSRAASAIAAVAAGENLLASYLPLAIKPMYLSLGFGWASGLLGFVALALTAAPAVLMWKGRIIREKSASSR